MSPDTSEKVIVQDYPIVCGIARPLTRSLEILK